MLLELFNANLCTVCSIETLKKLYHGGADLEALLNWLLEFGYLCRSDNEYELSFAGSQLARQLQAEAQGSQLQQHATDDLPATGPTALFAGGGLPLDTLRSGTLHLGRMATATEASATPHYLLSFEAPKNAPLTPILDGDVLGRQPEADICLYYDDCVSGRHCRFQTEAFGDRLLIYVEDLGSRNGTYLNCQRLEPRKLYQLNHGSRIEVGHTIMIVMQIAS